MIDDVTITLSRGCRIQGMVLGTDRAPKEGLYVQTTSADQSDNLCYNPFVMTDYQGCFDLKHVRPGQQLLSIGRYGGLPFGASKGWFTLVELQDGESTEGIQWWPPTTTANSCYNA